MKFSAKIISVGEKQFEKNYSFRIIKVLSHERSQELEVFVYNKFADHCYHLEPEEEAIFKIILLGIDGTTRIVATKLIFPDYDLTDDLPFETETGFYRTDKMILSKKEKPRHL